MSTKSIMRLLNSPIKLAPEKKKMIQLSEDTAYKLDNNKENTLSTEH